VFLFTIHVNNNLGTLFVRLNPFLLEPDFGTKGV
jgi:hypothetical protein